MLAIRITCFLLLLVLTPPIEAIVLSLRQFGTELNNFSTELDQPLTIDLHLDPKGETVVGISVFITFSGLDLQLVDTKKETVHIIEGAESTDLLTDWVVLDNDMHGDPGNDIEDDQIDYVALLFRGEGKAIINASVVARFKFKPLRAAKQASIQFDQDVSRSRVTEVTLLTNNGQQKQSSATLNSATLNIRGGPIVKPIPEVRFLNTETSAPLYLNNYIEDDGEFSKQQLKWLDVPHAKIATQIDQITNKAIFSVKGNDKKNFFGSAIIDLQVANNKQYTAMTEVRIEVMAAPIIKLLPDKRLKLNREEIFDLGQFVTDIDQPDLNGLTWTWFLAQESDNDAPVEVSINKNLVTLRGKKETENSAIRFIARDRDGNKTEANMKVTVLPDVNGPIVSDFPLLVFTVDGTQVLPAQEIFNLDNYVIDALSEDEQIKWEVTGNKLIEVQGLSSRRPTFRANTGGIKEDFLIVAENHLGQKSNKKSILVEVVPVGVPPRIDQAKFREDLLNENGVVTVFVDPEKTLPFEKRSHQIVLSKYVQDYNNPPEDITWSVIGNDKIQVVIEERTVTLSASVVAKENITFKATDSNGYTDDVAIVVESVKITPPTIKEFPQTIKLKANQSWSDIELDLYITDTFTPPEQIRWFVITPDPKLLMAKILADRRLELKVIGDWVGETIILLTATNQFGKIAKQELKVRVTEAPRVTLPEDLSLQAGWKRNITLDKYVQDADSPDEVLKWDMTPASSPVAELNSIDRKLILQAPKDRTGQTFPLQLTVTDEESNRTVVNIKVVVSSSLKLPFSLAKDVPKEVSFINDELARIDLTKKIIDETNDQPMDTELISSNLTFDFELEDKASNLKFKWKQEKGVAGETFILSTPDVSEEFEIQPAETIILSINGPNGSSIDHFFQLSIFPSKPMLDKDQLKKPIMMYPALIEEVDLTKYSQQKEGIDWEIENIKQLEESGLKISTDKNQLALKLLQFTPPKDKELNLIDHSLVGDIDFLEDNMCPDRENCFGFYLDLKVSRKNKFSQGQLPVIIIKPPELKLNLTGPIVFWAASPTDPKPEVKTFDLEDLIQQDPVSEREWNLSTSSSLSDIKTNWLSVELEASDFLTLTVYEPKNKEWIKPDLREGIPIKAGTPFLQLTPSEKFATDFKEGKLLVTATDIWNQKVTREITIQSIQPPRLQGFPAIINIFCGQANYQSEIGTSYLDLYPLVFLDPLAKTDKEKLEWSWRIWDDNKKVYREPEKSDKLRIDFGQSKDAVQITEKLMTISTMDDFFVANEKAPSEDKKIRIVVTDSNKNGETESMTDITLRIWKPRVVSERPILQGLEDQTVYPGQEVRVDFTLFDLDNSSEELVWTQSVPETLVVELERKVPLAGVQKGIIKVGVAKGFEEVRGDFTLQIKIKDPDCNELEEDVMITIIDQPDKTPPQIEVFAVPHPLFPQAIFITIISNEPLETIPSVTVGQQRLKPAKSSIPLIWNQIHYLEDNQQGVFTVLAKGTDLNKNTGQGKTSIKLENERLAAPNQKPMQTQLHSNYPNPFNPETWIPYQLAKGSNVSIKIYDTNGNLIWETDKGWQAAGFYIKPNKAAYWDGKTTQGEKVSSGVYFCHIVTDHKTEIQPLTLLK